jgi:ubiquinone/menaquinone biosynthesis C-methylase UbiE
MTAHTNPGAHASLSARLLQAADGMMDRIYGPRKRAIYGRLPSTVVEIGPGAGANLRYYAPRTRVIAIEPDSGMHPVLQSRAEKFQLDLQIKTIRAEDLDLPDGSVEAVIGTLVLCTVQNPRQVVQQIRRVLQSGGRYIFLEHVAALPGTRLRGAQDLMLRPWRRLFEGCHLNRESNQVIHQAGFSRVDMDCFVMKSRWLPFAPHIFGVAVN